MDKCLLCGHDLQNGEKTVILREKGAKGINESSALQFSEIHVSIGQTVHVDCRRNFCRRPTKAKSISDHGGENTQIPSRNRRFQVPRFDFRVHCFLCGLVDVNANVCASQ